jgi:ABC toxin N-terminal region/Neuraminidase-like domain/Putative peptidoglycan binding domain
MSLDLRDLKLESSGDDVRLLHSELLTLGLQVPETERLRAIFGQGTHDALTEFQKQHGLNTTGVVDATTAALLDEQIKLQAPYLVGGRVYAQRAGVASLTIHLVDKNAGPDVPLGSGWTDTRGAYSIRYSPARLKAAGKSAPDIQVLVLAGDKLLAASEVRYNATPSERLDVRLPASASASLPAEFDSLSRDITSHFHGRPAELQETDTRTDVTYIANKTGWDARAVALVSLADHFSQQTKGSVSPALFYALFRAGLPANEDVLYHTAPATLQAIWKQAIAQGVISAPARDIDAAVHQFQTLSADQMLNGRAVIGPSTMKQMLEAADLTAEQQRKFADLYAVHAGESQAFWKAAKMEFGNAAPRLQNAGKLAFLTLNNAPLMRTMAAKGGAQDLALAGFHRASEWKKALDPHTPVPAQIPGDTDEEKRDNYAEYMAAQIRISFPTAALAEMVQAGDLPVDNANAVHQFLTQHLGKFEISTQPVAQYIARNKLSVDDGVVSQVKRLQRVYQMTTSDPAMGVLLKNSLDAAYHVVKLDQQTFLKTYGHDLGGDDEAASIYRRSVQIHGLVLNVAASYLTGRNSIPIGNTRMLTKNGGGQVLNGAPNPPAAPAAPGAPGPAAASPDIVAYPTLESLFGSMDFCSCEECRSILSPAAYLVDLLLFLDQSPPPGGTKNPQQVLLGRRPDIEQLPLTCENTNTALPYIDLVNETLEYYVANTVQPLSLKDYPGHDTNGTASEDLIAAPQFVMDMAYTKLLGEFFPLILPFHQPLEILRRCFGNFGAPLDESMQTLRVTDAMDAAPYGWRDILMEKAGFSRQEYRVLTDSTLTLQQIYGFAPAALDADVFDAISNAKAYARRLDISYDDLVSLLKTHFVNPNSALIGKLEPLNVGFGAIAALQAGTMSKANFLALLPTGAAAPEPAEYGGDIAAWLTDPANFNRIMHIITLTDPTNATSGCTFGNLELRYSRPVTGAADKSTRLGRPEFTRLLRFIRVWQKTGWTIEQTDAAVCALFRGDLGELQTADVDTLAALDAGFANMVSRLGVLLRVMDALNLTPQRDLYSLLACWNNIETQGEHSLYRQMFVNPAMQAQDSAFGANAFGEFLTAPGLTLGPHAEAIRGAFNLTGEEYDQITAALKYTALTKLDIGALSGIFRRGWLARKLRLNVREFLMWTSLTGIDPFAAPDIGAGPEPPIWRLIALVKALRDRSIKSAVALYLFWNQDITGKSAPDPAQALEFARTLRGDFASIDDQFAAAEDPTGDLLRARMTLVYGQDVADGFFAFLDNTLALDAPYTQAAPALDTAITAVDPGFSYDAFRHLLSHSGVLSLSVRNNVNAILGVSANFQTAVNAIYNRSQDALASFFSRYPELKPMYTSYVASPDPPEKKRTALLAAFQPSLSRLRKREQALQRLSAAAAFDLDATRRLLDPSAVPFPLHAAGDAARPVLDDFIAVETPGLKAQFFYRDTATGLVDKDVAAANNLAYAKGGANPLPANPVPANAISGIWQGTLEIPDAGFYNLVVEAEDGSTVTLTFNDAVQPLARNGNVWRNSNPLELKAGKLYSITLRVDKVKDALTLNWETPKRAREVIPGRYLYPPSVLPPGTDAYVRFLKAASIAAAFKLTAKELAHFATDSDYHVAGAPWLNALAVTGDPATPADLLPPFAALLDFARLKAELSDDQEALLDVLETQSKDVLLQLTLWDKTSLDDVMTHFGAVAADLQHFATLRKVYGAFAPILTIGISASKLFSATTNDPGAGPVRDFQAALRARYDASDWRALIQPINDSMRSAQRDALVAYILQQMRSNPATAMIDTPDKLFEFFLVDVEMEPCMQTSRIRNALSSVQLFVERCLLNLEPDVSPDSINAERWLWMKRYRVWEANRKVFLFPENWLEPELRDDKSPIFKEAESELMQGDITDDVATTAYLNYLSKLAEIARLTPCGMFEDEETGKVHVVARNSGAHRKYYYRRFEFGYWTAWEQIPMDIDDNPVIPVVWNRRLMLFWLKIMKQTPLKVNDPPDPGTGEQDLAHTHLSDIGKNAVKSSGNIKVTIQAALSYAEFYNGKWQGPKTSDMDAPADLGQFPAQGAGAFDRSSMQLWSHEVEDGLQIAVSGAGVTSRGFLLYNTHSLPVVLDHGYTAPIYGYKRWFETSGPVFTVDYDHRIPDVPDNSFPRDVLKDSAPMGVVQPNHYVSNLWEAPFFFYDPKCVFYVESIESEQLVRDFSGFGVIAKPDTVAKVPNIVLERPPKIGPKYWGDGGPIGPQAGVIDPAPISQFITEDANIRRGLPITVNVQFGQQQIGPGGAASLNVQEEI